MGTTHVPVRRSERPGRTGARITSLDDLVVDYRCGQVAFDLADPGRVVARGTEPWLQPTTAEELSGMVPRVTFVEGLVSLHGQWLAYYGQSDTTTGVAVAPAAAGLPSSP